MNPWVSDLHCPQVSIYRVFPIPWEGRLEIYTRAGTPRVCTRSFRFKCRDLYTEQTEASSKYRKIEGFLIGSQTTQRLQSFWRVVSSWDHFLPGLGAGRTCVCPPRKEGPNTTASGASGTQTWIWPRGWPGCSGLGCEILSTLRVFKRNLIFLPGEGWAEELRSLPYARTRSSQPNKHKIIKIVCSQ